MSNPMGPPPPKNPPSNPANGTKPIDQLSSSSSSSSPIISETTLPTSLPPSTPMLPPSNPQSSNSHSSQSTTVHSPPPPPDSTTNVDEPPTLDNSSQTPKPPSHGVAVPYKIPPWSGPPCHEFCLEVLKDGSIVDKFNVFEKGAYMFGRLDLCDFVLEHPTISRFHAVIQFKRSGDAYLYDLGSTHGTFLNKNQVEKNTYVDLHVGDVIRFGRSSRLFIFQGPSDLMPPETNKKLMREVKMREAMLDREASLQRARLESSVVDGISWGMDEDAIEEDEDDADEVTWQSYKGQLTEKQEKTREKVLKRMEKIANMKKEISSIRVKDISQGGLTQGQQTQIARNEQRMAQIMEELENLEETLNDSIRESLGARSGRISHGKKKGAVEDEECLSDDDDEFYDRTKRKPHQKPGDNQSIETADTLLDKRDAIIKEMNEKKELLMTEKNNILSQTATEVEVSDPLDAYMSGLSSQLVYDKSVQLEKELSTLQSELDRICYLLKIADPTGEAAKKRELKVQETKPNKSEEVASTIKNKPHAETQKSSEPCAKADNKSPVETQKISEACAKADGSIQGEKPADATVGLDKSQPGSDRLEAENVVYTVSKPQWLGAVEDMVTNDTQQLSAPLHLHETDKSDQFVDYKDRNKILGTGDDDAKTSLESKLESAAPGLILRKRKQVETSGMNSYDAKGELTSSTSGEQTAEDAVALLLKHKRGLYAADVVEGSESPDDTNNIEERKKPKRVLGPEKPSFLCNEMDNDTWVPPEGQSGDGRTSLNDKFGY